MAPDLHVDYQRNGVEAEWLSRFETSILWTSDYELQVDEEAGFLNSSYFANQASRCLGQFRIEW